MMRTLLCCLAFFLPLALFAQSYDAALGLRLGTEIGATVQLRVPQIHKSFVIEGIVHQSLRRNAGQLTLLGKQHRNLLTRRLNIFYGAGAHLGWTDEINPKTNETYGRPFGIDGILGAEATFAKINASFDFKPSVNVGSNAFPVTLQTAVSVRYVIAKRNEIWDKMKEKANRRDKRRRQKERRREKRRRDREKEGKDPNGWRFWKKDGR